MTRVDWQRILDRAAGALAHFRPHDHTQHSMRESLPVWAGSFTVSEGGFRVTTSDGQPETVTVEEYVRHNPGLLEDEAIAYCEERSIPCRFEIPKRRLRRS
jgi:hypothetical protein